MMRKTKLALATLSLSLLTLAAAAPAFASDSIGQLNPPYSGAVCGPAAVVQTGVQPGTAVYWLPPGEDAVITGWRTQTGPSAGSAKLLVLRPTGAANQYAVIGSDGPRPVAALSAPSFGGLRIPIQPGDAVGLYASGVNCGSYFSGSAYTESAFPVGLDPAMGTTIGATGFGSFFALEVQATVERDADGDGYGDDSQDLCPGYPEAHALPCTPPPASPPQPPSLSLHGRAVQRALEQGGVVEVASSDQPAALRATGTLAIAGSKRRLPLRAAGASAAPGADTRLLLRFTAREKRRVAAALRRGKRVRAQVEVAAQAGGASASASQRISISKATNKAKREAK